MCILRVIRLGARRSCSLTISYSQGRHNAHREYSGLSHCRNLCFSEQEILRTSSLEAVSCERSHGWNSRSQDPATFWGLWESPGEYWLWVSKRCGGWLLYSLGFARR